MDLAQPSSRPRVCYRQMLEHVAELINAQACTQLDVAGNRMTSRCVKQEPVGKSVDVWALARGHHAECCHMLVMARLHRVHELHLKDNNPTPDLPQFRAITTLRTGISLLY